MRLFLSYAEEDRAIAAEIAEWLRSQRIEFYDWRDPMQPGGRFIKQIEDAMAQSDAFLALLSPSFLASDWCGQERELAMQRQQDLHAADPDFVFIHVLQILTTPSSDAGFLRNYGWVDLTRPETRDATFDELASRLKPVSQPEPARPGPASEPEPARTGPSSEPEPAVLRRGEVAESSAHEAMRADRLAPVFRNRDEELEKVLRDLTNAGGRHFWLVIAPPQLGKTWFLRQVMNGVPSSGSAGWVTRLVDLRAQTPDVCSDAAALLALLFDLTPPVTIEEETLFSIAREIIRTEKPYLCLLDSAELLDPETAATLRSCLSQIYLFVQDAHKNDVRLALIVASRQEEDWRGVTPAPRLSPLPLTEFKADVVQQALHELALAMKRTYSAAELRKYAALVHRLTEGLPALLVRCLQWIEAQEWVRMERMESQELFEKLTDPYIQEWLLTPDSLLPGRHGQPTDPLHALEQAYRVLSPYRLFTQSHLRHHFESDPALSAALMGQRWVMVDLWRAISGTALLSRPLNEPWQEIHAAIRRLLHRYYCRSDEDRAEAHSEARKFVEVWAERQSGKEQVIGLVECLWHEATVLRLREPAEMAQRLSESARSLSRGLRESSAYTLDELRDYASKRMRDDEELQEAVSDVDGLFTKLVEIVATPQQES